MRTGKLRMEIRAEGEKSATEGWLAPELSSDTVEPLTPKLLKKAGSHLCRGIRTLPATGADRAGGRWSCWEAQLWAEAATEPSYAGPKEGLPGSAQKARGTGDTFLIVVDTPQNSISRRGFRKQLNSWPKMPSCFLITCSASE